mmetsp:Transcript_10411/g.42328  ORF Transcript_10411/g.42328 Transcript_10411/m.42328 type:complete len:1086 (-) Transcript_10411:53-3310(-)
MVQIVRRGKLTRARIVDNLDGTFAVSYFPDRIGDYNVHVKLNGRRIKGAPFDAFMRRPVLDLYGCQIDGGYAEDETEFSLQLEHKDVQLVPEEHLQLRIADPKRRQLVPNRVHYDKALGRVTVAYTPMLPGEHVVDVISFGKHVAGCPFSCFFQPKEITFDGIKKGDVVDLPASLIYVKLGLGWTFPKGTKPLDLDASCIMMRFHHKQDHAFFNDPRSLDGSVILTGDNRTGMSDEKAKRKQEKREERGKQERAMEEHSEHSEEAEGVREDRGDLPQDDGVEEESIFVRLRRVSLKFTHLFFTVTVFNKGRNFESVESAFVKLVDVHTNEVLYRYDLNKANSSAVLVCVLFRNGPSLWRLRIIDDACEGRVFNAMVKREILGKYIGPPEPPARRYEVVVKKATDLNEKRMKIITSVFPVVTFDHHVEEGKAVAVRDPMRPKGVGSLHPEFRQHSFEVVGHTNIIEISLWGFADEPAEERQSAFRKHGRKASKTSLVTSLAGKVTGHTKVPRRRRLFLGRVYYDVDLLPAKGSVHWYGLRVHPLESDDLHALGSLQLSVKELPPPEPEVKKGKKKKKKRRKDEDEEEEEEEEEDDFIDEDDEDDDFEDEEDEEDEAEAGGRGSRPVGSRPVGSIPRGHPTSHGLDTSKRRIIAFVGGLDLTGGRWDIPEHPLFSSMGVEHAKDFYQGWKLKATMGPRQPWHDIHSMVEGPVARDVMENFTQRWKKQGKTPAYQFNPGLYLTEEEEEQYVERTMQGTTTSTPWGVRLLRSIDEYSAVDVHGREAGIQKAYITAIRNCKRFIYIENQYFMGSAHHWNGNGTVCYNLIPYEIATRIARSIDEHQPIYAYIVVPLFPEGLPDSGALQEVLRWQWKTMDMMYTIVSQALARNGVNHHPQNYLNFYCPGNREEAHLSTATDKVGNAQTHPVEYSLIQMRRFMIYVHSKMMIVDDEEIIVGSANINERSMAGDRDTEIAILAHQSANRGRTRESNAAIHRFRLSLWVEHCGKFMPEFEHPNTDACLVAVNTIADQNWAQFMDEKTTTMHSHLMHYPAIVFQDGSIKPALPHFPENPGSIEGNRNHMLPDKVTT